MPAGYGKSFVMLLVAALLIKLDLVDTIYLYYHEKEIIDAEREFINHIKLTYKEVQINAISFDTLEERQKIKVPEGTIVIADEADAAFLDRRLRIKGEGYVLGLTATGLSALRPEESDFLSNKVGLDMLIMSSGIETGVTDFVPQISLDDFFQRQSNTAKLIYVGPKYSLKQFDEIFALCRLHNLKFQYDLGTCTVKDLRKTRKDQVYIVKEERLMRGFDYSSVEGDGNGISLLICAPLRSYRELRQALGRVGRTGDSGERFATCLHLVDEVRAM